MHKLTPAELVRCKNICTFYFLSVIYCTLVSRLADCSSGSESSAWAPQVSQQSSSSVGAERESPETTSQARREPCTPGPGQSQHHQGGKYSAVRIYIFALFLIFQFQHCTCICIFLVLSVELNSVVWRCCRFSLISCCCRMCWPVLTKPWLWSKTCLEMLHAGTPVSGNLFCVQINRCSD